MHKRSGGVCCPAMVTSVRARCGSCSWGGRGALHVCSHREPCAPSATPDWHPGNRASSLWHPQIPERAFHCWPLQPALDLHLTQSKGLKEQRCGTRGHVQSWKTAALVITGGKIRALKKARKPRVLGWLCQVSICVSPHLPALPPSSGQVSKGRKGAGHTTVLLLLLQ